MSIHLPQVLCPEACHLFAKRALSHKSFCLLADEIADFLGRVRWCPQSRDQNVVEFHFSQRHMRTIACDSYARSY